jgi:hypothetical protein
MKKILLVFPLLAVLLFGCKKEFIDTTQKEGALKGYHIDGIGDFILTNLSQNTLQTWTVMADSTPREELTISISGLPSGITAEFEKSKGVPDFTSKVQFKVSGIPKAGNHIVKVTLTSAGGYTKSENLKITVPGNTFSIYPDEYNDIFLYKNSTSFRQFTIYSNPFTDKVSLNFSDLPLGLTAVFDKNDFKPPFTTNVEFNTSAANLGNYQIKLNILSAAGYSDTKKINLVITDSCFGAFIGTFTNCTVAANGNPASHINDVTIYHSNDQDANSLFTDNTDINYFRLNCNDNTINIPTRIESTSGVFGANDTSTFSGTYSISPLWVKITKTIKTYQGETFIVNYELKP